MVDVAPPQVGSWVRLHTQSIPDSALSDKDHPRWYRIAYRNLLWYHQDFIRFRAWYRKPDGETPRHAAVAEDLVGEDLNPAFPGPYSEHDGTTYSGGDVWVYFTHEEFGEMFDIPLKNPFKVRSEEEMKKDNQEVAANDALETTQIVDTRWRNNDVVFQVTADWHCFAGLEKKSYFLISPKAKESIYQFRFEYVQPQHEDFSALFAKVAGNSGLESCSKTPIGKHKVAK
ncbi:Hypothetical protein R9X50_00514200 [Acrodontium crateriforme]|uniref:Uncharacterized protein n=1 Tax=Acrodontium crateriforme TaxID=150365 RepID=A0AAQ3M7E8_9PEZI|nr:Hypothetical protein R9X50_00514200 [Acrodontium crateriforme]